MVKMLRAILFVAATALVLFGYLCLNYTRGATERHVAFAQRHQLPLPSKPIFFAGIVLVSAGAGAVGYQMGGSGTRQRAK
jgi:hypothetical protein